MAAHGKQSRSSWSDNSACPARQFGRASAAELCYYLIMLRMRKFIRGRRASALLAIYIGYMLAIEAVMASVGLGMSAFAAPGQTGFVICDLAAGLTGHVPATGGDPQKHAPQPQCPFCFVAAQGGGHAATAGEPPAFHAYVGIRVAGRLSEPRGDKLVLLQPRRTVGDPRAPPVFSV
jgi:hypothetical protein